MYRTANLVRMRLLVSKVRFTVADSDGTTSFVGPGHAIKMLVAACSRGPSNLRDLLDFTRKYDEEFVQSVRRGLAWFDEHNVKTDTRAIDRVISEEPAGTLPPFRVYNEATRSAAGQPVETGLIVFNLNERRIIQVQNSYGEIQRTDRGRIRKQGRPIRLLYHYDLPNEWALLP